MLRDAVTFNMNSRWIATKSKDPMARDINSMVQIFQHHYPKRKKRKKKKMTAILGKQHYLVASMKDFPAAKGNMTDCKMLFRCNRILELKLNKSL